MISEAAWLRLFVCNLFMGLALSGLRLVLDQSKFIHYEFALDR